MTRLKMSIPDTAILVHQEKVPVLVNHINYGNHLGHDSLISILHEARLRFIKKNGITDEVHIHGDIGFMIKSLAITYDNEAFHGDELMIEISASDISKSSCDLNYKVTKIDNGIEKPVAIASTCLVFVDFKHRKAARMPQNFLEILEKKTPSSEIKATSNNSNDLRQQPFFSPRAKM